MKNRSLFRTLKRTSAAVIFSLCATSAFPAVAQEMRVATNYKLLTLDPYFAVVNQNTSLLLHIYERLVTTDFGDPAEATVGDSIGVQAPETMFGSTMVLLLRGRMWHRDP